MTRACAARVGPATAGATDAVRPFAGWLVRAEAAATEVDALSDAAVAAQPVSRAVRPGSYEPVPPALYLYRRSTSDGEYTGIVCDIAPEAFLDGRVLGHEAVQPDRVDGLARHLATNPQRVELVSTLHRAGPVVRATLQRLPARRPDRDVRGLDGSRHTVWRIPAGRQTDDLCRELGAATHYIADGHHRVAAGLRVWAGSGYDSGRGVLCVAYPLDGLRLSSIARRVAGPVDPAHVRGLLEAGFEVRPATGPSSDIAMYVDRRWYSVTWTGDRPPGARGLDVSLLHDCVLDRLPPGTGVEPTREPVDALVAACDADGGVLFALAAPTLDTLTAIADAGEVVPAKSTFFSPKPGSGIFLRAPAG